MKLRRVSTGAVVLLLVAVVSPVTRAGFVTFAFEGEVTSVRDDNGLLGGAVNAGTPFSGAYTFDSLTPDGDPHPSRGLYENAITGFSGSVGGLSFFGPVGSDSTIDIQNDWLIPPSDEYVLSLDTTFVGHQLGTLLGLYDITGQPLSSDELSFVPPDPALFEYPVFILSDSSEVLGLGLTGNLTSLTLVPEPSTLITLGSGAWLVSRRRGRTVSFVPTRAIPATAAPRRWRGRARRRRPGCRCTECPASA